MHSSDTLIDLFLSFPREKIDYKTLIYVQRKKNLRTFKLYRKNFPNFLKVVEKKEMSIEKKIVM